MPQSRHRKSKARKRPKGLYANPGPQTQSRSTKNRTVQVVALIVLAGLVLATVIYVLNRRSTPSGGPETTTASGLKYVDLVVGDGPSPQVGQTLSVHYTGTLVSGKKFDSSRDRGVPMEFQYGRTPMIKGWDEGLKTMKVGGRRMLTIPPNLAYGPGGKPPDIPPNSTLVFDIELLSAK